MEVYAASSDSCVRSDPVCHNSDKLRSALAMKEAEELGAGGREQVEEDVGGTRALPPCK